MGIAHRRRGTPPRRTRDAARREPRRPGPRRGRGRRDADRGGSRARGARSRRRRRDRDGRRGRRLPGRRRRRRQAPEGRRRPGRSSCTPTTDIAQRARPAAAARPGARRVRRRARGGRASSASARCCDDKNVDLVVYNDVGRSDIGFDSPDNEVTLITADGDRLVARAPKPVDRGRGARRGRATARGPLMERRRRAEPRRSRRPPQPTSPTASWPASRPSCTRRARPCGCRSSASSPRGTSSSRTSRASGRRCSRRRSPARSTSASRGSSSRRTCCPSDVTGVNVYDQQEGRFRFRPGPGVRERAARRRGQPRLAEDPVGAARGDAGGAGDGRRRDLRARAAVPRDRDPEPRRVRGHVPAARGPARPVRRQDVDRLPAARRRGADARRADGRAAARRARAGRRARGAARRDRGGARDLRRGERARATSSHCSGTPARTGTWRSARARVRASRSCASRRHARSSSAGSSSTPDDIRELAEHRALPPAPARARGALGGPRPRPTSSARRSRGRPYRCETAKLLGHLARAPRPRRLVALRLEAGRRRGARLRRSPASSPRAVGARRPRLDRARAPTAAR